MQLGACSTGQAGILGHADPLRVGRFSPSAWCWKSASLAIGFRDRRLCQHWARRGRRGRSTMQRVEHRCREREEGAAEASRAAGMGMCAWDARADDTRSRPGNSYMEPVRVCPASMDIRPFLLLCAPLARPWLHGTERTWPASQRLRAHGVHDGQASHCTVWTYTMTLSQAWLAAGEEAGGRGGPEGERARWMDGWLDGAVDGWMHVGREGERGSRRVATTCPWLTAGRRRANGLLL